MNVNNIFLTNIQRFSLHDGPGIRTTVFLKGCSLRCPWCSNPENLLNHIQPYLKDGIEGTYGRYCTADEVYAEVVKDKPFYSSEIDVHNISDPSLLDKLPGGVTFSGGECLLQMRQLEPLIKRLDEEHIHTAVETCLFIPEEDLNLAIKYIDLFYVDIKILDKELCSRFLHGNIELYTRNFDILMSSGKSVVVRVPVIGGYTDGVENRTAVCTLINKYKDRILKVELIKEHNLGTSKYKSLADLGNSSFEVPDYIGVSDDLMEEYKIEIKKIGLWVETCKI